jgi:hypothetical protein
MWMRGSDMARPFFSPVPQPKPVVKLLRCFREVFEQGVRGSTIYPPITRFQCGR